MKDKAMFSGIMPAMLTPYDENQKLIRHTVKKIMDLNYAAGVSGFYVCGGAGEGPVLRPSLRMEMIEAVMEANASRGKIIVHVGSPNILDTIELAKHAASCGSHAIASLAPTYQFNYTPAELEAYYRTLAESVDIPVMVYCTDKIPKDAVVGLMSNLIKVDNIIGLKYTMDNYDQMLTLTRLNDGNICVFNGPDSTLVCGLLMGAKGGIGATYSIMPELYVDIYKKFSSGNISGAVETQSLANKAISVLLAYSKTASIKSMKAVLRYLGLDYGDAAFPAEHYDAAKEAALVGELKQLGVIK